MIIETSKTAFERLTIYILKISGQNYIFTLGDKLIQFPQVYSLLDKLDKIIAYTLLLYFQHFGTPFIQIAITTWNSTMPYSRTFLVYLILKSDFERRTSTTIRITRKVPVDFTRDD